MTRPSGNSEPSAKRTRPPHRIAVIGSGVAGLVAAHVATGPARVSLYEADDRLGGHADTHSVDGLRIDTGFIVHNRRTYPTLLRLFEELDVATQESEMSLSVSDLGTGLEYAGALGPRGLFPTTANLTRPAYLRMLVEIPRFHRKARRLLAKEAGSPAGQHELTLRDFLRQNRFSDFFVRHFAEPLVAAVWSCDPARALDYPARHLFTFLQHHGMLQVFGSPTWRTVSGGSHTYVDRLAAGLHEVRLGRKVTSVLETETGVEVTDSNGDTVTFDAVIIATHPPESLSMLADPTTTQREILSALPYSANTALLHTDTSLLPQAKNAQASWNFQRPLDPTGQVTVTYDMTRLQRLDTGQQYLVTLGGDELVDPSTVIARREYAHPLFTPESVAARDRRGELDTARICFAGAWQGWGFHEDGARSGWEATQRLGLVRPSWTAYADSTSGANPHPTRNTRPRLVDTTIRHTRRDPLRHQFSYRSHTWLVDLDHLPASSRWASFEARDHLGDPHQSLRTNVVTFLAAHGIDLDGDHDEDNRGRVQLLAHPRALGHCFNPISVFWCWHPDETLAGVIVEVHNTYGDRHAYLVHPDAHGRAEVDKAMYVSPFHDVSGRYEVVVPAPGDEPEAQVAVSVSLHRDGAKAFTASLTGTATAAPATKRPPLRVVGAALLGTIRIRKQGLTLWLRRLPIQPRPAHHRPEGV